MEKEERREDGREIKFLLILVVLCLKRVFRQKGV
jgi:hypothetical protein